MKELLEKFGKGALSIDEAEEMIVRTLYDHGEDFLLDLHRHHRTGFPEVVFAQGKTFAQIRDIVASFLEKNSHAFVSLADEETIDSLKQSFPRARIRHEGGLVAVSTADPVGKTLGTAGVITAGTADTPFARECALLLEETGVNVIRAFDFGVSGMHRPFLGIRETDKADLLVVFAGMDGILPTMIASMTDKPVIAVPTPVGYGLGGGGDTALRTMLQSCVPGLVVLNIGNSVGAAAAAVRILRAITKRSAQPTDGNI